MNRIPPNLLYLTIYNPTLQPTEIADGDNEDAEEQAHILFYTSKERAVSRDRMLRQIGLAKALVNFAELFNADDPCNNVHSQSRRMIMVSPEPNFWIHACVEVARTPKVEHAKGKSKSKSKPTDKGKEKDLLAPYEWEDGSVHDNALHADILKGYERFKLTHGSFTSILANLGQQALELQLERFFTVWAWSWNLEDGHNFGESFGSLLHPYSSRLIPLVDEFSEILSANIIPVVLTFPYVIPSTRYTDRCYPASLAMHLLGMVPPRRDPSDALDALDSSVDTLKCRDTPGGHNPNIKDSDASSTFLGMPAMGVNMDMRKWNWPGYLTFGRSNGPKQGPDKIATPTSEKEKTITGQEISHVEVEVNASALEDAISSDSISRLLVHPEGQGEDQHGTPNNIDGDGLPTSPSPPLTTPGFAPDIDGPFPSAPSPPPLPEFSMTRLHLAPLDSPTSTAPVTIHYFIRNQVMLALIKTEENPIENYDVETGDLETAAKGVLSLFDEIHSRIPDADQKSLSESLPSASKILQTRDQYIISTGQYTKISPGFSSKSNHLFNAMAILSSGSDTSITEVFSRGQNPQHWHIGKRGLRQAVGDGKESTNGDEAMFLEVFRKESSLTDVDNVLAGIVRMV